MYTPTRKLSGQMDANGQSAFPGFFTSEYITSPVEVPIDLRRVIPVILIPGIMGTKLRSTSLDKNIWDPPTSTWDELSTFFAYLFKNTKRRVAELDPKYTVVDDGIPSDSDAAHNIPIQTKRGWNALYKISYHPLMEHIENTLNSLRDEDFSKMFRISPREYGGTKWDYGTGSDVSPESLTVDDYKIAVRYKYDVWGGGYNWLQGNDISADALWDFVETKVLPSYPESIINKQKKVILVSHSMGGLVARSLCKKHKEQILGVIHLAQPASGAPAVYKRMRAGYEGLEQVVLGRNAADVTGILCRAQGGLDLLPFANYDKPSNNYEAIGQPWLICSKETGKKSELLHLPATGDPYTDIYRLGTWYALLPDENLRYILLNDTATPDDFKKCRKKFTMIIDEVQKFHESIANVYHPCTYAVWGEGRNSASEAWRRIEWKAKHYESRDNDYSMFNSAQPKLHDNGNGYISHGEYSYFLKQHNGPGDGTVPDVSAQHQENWAKEYFVHGDKRGSQNQADCWEHQDCCINERVKWATLYSIVKIVAAGHP